MIRGQNPWVLAGALLWIGLIIPWARALLESTMTLQMLVQIPLLALAGAWMVQGRVGKISQRLSRWNAYGISGLLLASITGMLWMLPIAMDAAISQPLVTWTKMLSVPIFIGMAVAVSWPLANFVVRGVVILELIATTVRIGWLYLIAPDRLCSNYLLDDQQQLGTLLIAIGAVITLITAWNLIWGHPMKSPAKIR